MHKNQYKTLRLLDVVVCKLADIGRWEHICPISCDVTKTELT